MEPLRNTNSIQFMSQPTNNDYNVVDAIVDSMKGNFADKQTTDSRRQICESCDKKNGAFCSICHCWISWATAMPGKSCPIGKWQAVKNDTK